MFQDVSSTTIFNRLDSAKKRKHHWLAHDPWPQKDWNEKLNWISQSLSSRQEQYREDREVVNESVKAGCAAFSAFDAN